MTILAVIDTSCLVSNSHREHLVTAAQEGLYVPIWSPWIIAELNRVMTWNWIKNKGVSEKEKFSRRYKEMMSILTGSFRCVDPKPPWIKAWPSLTDKDDLPIWSTAKYAEAQYIVSLNTNDFPPPNKYGIHIWEGIEYIVVLEFFRRIQYEF